MFADVLSVEPYCGTRRKKKMRELKIDPKFETLLPQLTENELLGLEQSLLEEGCRDALVCWDDTILDGHNRYPLCKKHNIPFKVIDKEFSDHNSAEDWIIDNQLSRRNLTPQQSSYYRWIKYKREKKQANGFGDRDLSVDQNDPRDTTAERIAKETGVSAPTIKRDAKFAEAVDKLEPEERKGVLSGRSKKTKQQIISAGDVIAAARKKTKPSENKPDDSDALFQLKRWWKRATQKDRNLFKQWIKNNP